MKVAVYLHLGFTVFRREAGIGRTVLRLFFFGKIGWPGNRILSHRSFLRAVRPGAASYTDAELPLRDARKQQLAAYVADVEHEVLQKDLCINISSAMQHQGVLAKP